MSAGGPEASVAAGGPAASVAAGKAARARVPLESHREFDPRLAAHHRARRRQTDYYLRQLRDWKYSAPVDQMGPATMAGYGELCAWTLARASEHPVDQAVRELHGCHTVMGRAIRL